jgi:hypothetical protein
MVGLLSVQDSERSLPPDGLAGVGEITHSVELLVWVLPPMEG